MTKYRLPTLKIAHRFDSDRCRHYLNDICSVLHCHHYATLYTQLAIDAKQFDGVRHLVQAAEDTFYDVLDGYYRANEILEVDEKVDIAQQYWQAVGMGLIRFTGIGPYEAIAEMPYSHVDEGWLKKWGSQDSPVNFFTVGFVAAVAALVNNKARGSFVVRETKALVCGDEKSEFKAVLR